MADARLPLSADIEQRSLEDVYRTEFAGLMRLAFLMTGSNAVAEDLVHDVFVRVADRVDSLEDPASDRAGRQRPPVAAAVDEQRAVVAIERRGRELAEPHVAECGPQVALDVADDLPGRLRREVLAGELEPPVE